MAAVSPYHFSRLIIVLVCAAALLGAKPAFAANTLITLEPLEDAAQTQDSAPKQTHETAQWKLSADSLTALNHDTVLEASGTVELTDGGNSMTADFARYFPETGWVYLRGNVHIGMDGGDTLNAAEAEFDLRNQTGWMYKGNLFVAAPHMYISGEKLIKHRGDKYSFTQATFTTCDGEKPAWSVSADSATVEIDGYATLHGAAMAIKNADLMYVPVAFLPVKVTRQAGLLPPDIGYSSKKGLIYVQPYFYPIDASHDITVYGAFMSHVGGGGGFEYRSAETDKDKSWFGATYLNDRRSTDHKLYTRSNDNRWWIRGMSDGEVGDSGWRYRVNFDLVSDEDFLSDFSGGLIGYDTSHDELQRMFHRPLRENNKNRLSESLIFKDWDRFGLAGSLRYEQNPVYWHSGGPAHSEDSTVQTLPRFDAFLFKNSVIDGIPLEAEAHVTASYIYRRAGTSGMRTQATPSVSLPLDLKYASFIPTFTLHQTWYNGTTLDHRFSGEKRFGNAADPSLNGWGSTIPEIDMQLYTEAHRVWLWDNQPLDPEPPNDGWFAGWVGLKHDIQPRLRYRHIAGNIDQNDNPYYDANDRLLPVNELTYSLTNILTRKKAVKVKTAVQRRTGTPGVDIPLTKEERAIADANPGITADELRQSTQTANTESDVRCDYLDIVRWKLEWGYDFNEADRHRLLDHYEKRPMTDVLSELTLHPLPWFSATARTYYSPYTGKFTRHDHSLTFITSQYLTWTTGLDYRSHDYNLRAALRHENPSDITTPTHLFKNAIRLNLPPHWALSYYDYRNLRKSDGKGWRGKGYEKGLVVSYSEQCWRINLIFDDNGEDKSFSVRFEIPGLWEEKR